MPYGLRDGPGHLPEFSRRRLRLGKVAGLLDLGDQRFGSLTVGAYVPGESRVEARIVAVGFRRLLLLELRLQPDVGP